MKQKHPFAAGCGLVLWAAVLVRAAPAGEIWSPDHPLQRIKSEKLVYRVRAWKQVWRAKIPFGVVGTARFTLARETQHGEPQFVLRAVANGNLPFYPYHAVMTSRLSVDGYVQRSADTWRDRPSHKRVYLRWHPRGIDYLKHDHCEAPSLCHNPNHQVTTDDGRLAHCTDYESCNNPAHYVWRSRTRHRDLEGAIYDVLGALYLARGLPVAIGRQAGPIRMITKRDIWEIRVRGRKAVTLEAGNERIRCIQLAFQTAPANPHARKNADEFEGPFGLQGDMDLYIAEDTLQVVKVEGKVKLDDYSIDVEVLLTSRSLEEL
jgi:hypothetical protein